MQSTYSPHDELVHEFFTARSKVEVFGKMDARLAELKGQGHTYVGRTKIGRNATCPCGSGRKFKKCCIAKAS